MVNVPVELWISRKTFYGSNSWPTEKAVDKRCIAAGRILDKKSVSLIRPLILKLRSDYPETYPQRGIRIQTISIPAS